MKLSDFNQTVSHANEIWVSYQLNKESYPDGNFNKDSIIENYHNYSLSLEQEVERLRDQVMVLGSHYGSALITIMDLAAFLKKSKDKILDHFDACIYCAWHLEYVDRELVGHGTDCALLAAEKVLANHKAITIPPQVGAASPGREGM